MSTFLWKIPSSNIQQKELLCHGYIRRNCSAYIIDPIIHLFARYYHEESFTLSDIQNATNLQLFVSPIFSYEGLSWYLELHPNGSNIENKGSVILYLCLILIPKHIRKISISFILSLQETGTTFRRIKTFDNKKWYMGWRRDALSFNKIQTFDELTFKVDMDMISMTYINSLKNDSEETKIFKIIDEKDEYKLSQISQLPITYKWNIHSKKWINKIRTAEISEHFNGPIMNYGPFKWYIQFIPKQSKMKSPWIGFRIWYCPQNIYKCLCKINIIFNELSLWKSTYKLFEDKSLLTVWAATFNDAQFEQFIKLNSYSFTVDVSVIDIIYNNKGENSNRNIDFKCPIFRPFSMNNLLYFCTEWKITNKNILNNIATAANVYSFVTDIFCDCITGLRWYLSLWPNGSRESRDGTVNIFLLLVTFTNEIIRIPIKFELEWVESNKTCKEYQIFSIDQCCGGETIWPLKTRDIKYLNSFTMKLKIYIADILGKCGSNNNYLLNGISGKVNTKYIPIPTDTFIWNVPMEVFGSMKTCQPTQKYMSPIFKMYNLEWYISFYPNGDKNENINHTVLYINLIKLPLEYTNAMISVRYIIFIKETNTKFAGEATFRNKHMYSSWDTERIATSKFRELKRFTIQLDIQLIDVFVDNKYCITNRFLSNEFVNKLKKDKKNMEYIIQLEMNELDYFVSNLNASNGNYKSVDECEINECKIENKKQEFELKKWFFDEVKMPKYYEMFVDIGITELNMIKVLNEHDLIQIGVYNSTDIAKFMIDIAILNVRFSS